VTQQGLDIHLVSSTNPLSLALHKRLVASLRLEKFQQQETNK
jgi:hypothetical protein